MILPNDYRNEVLNALMNNRRRYLMINNTDGTVSFIDRTVYDVDGSPFNADDINNITGQINANTDNIRILSRQITSGNVTGVKGSEETEWRAGDVELTAANVGAYTKAETEALISTMEGMDIQQVDTLPTHNISEKTIYLVPNSDPQASNQKDEYIYIKAFSFTNITTSCRIFNDVNNLPNPGESDIYYIVLNAGKIFVFDTALDEYVEDTSDSFEIVYEMPVIGEDGVFYIVESLSDAVYSCSVSSTWEKLGTTNVDLSNYYTKLETYNKTEVDNLIDGSVHIVVDDQIDSESTNPVENRVIADALDDKQDTLVLDDTPTNNSTNFVNSGVIKASLDLKANRSMFNNYYTIDEVDELISTTEGADFEVVDTLPVVNIKQKVIYLVPSSNPGTQNAKDEYIYIISHSQSDITSSSVVETSLEDFPLIGTDGIYYLTTDERKVYLWSTDDQQYVENFDLAFLIVNELPDRLLDNTIYLLSTNDHVYKDNPTGAWEMIGSTSIDLSNYYTSSQVDNLLADKQDELTTGDGIDITSDTITAKVDGTTISFDANGNLQVIGGGGPSAVSDLIDVYLKNLQNNQILKYNSSTQKWENQADNTGSDFTSQIESLSAENSTQTSEIGSLASHTSTQSSEISSLISQGSAETSELTSLVSQASTQTSEITSLASQNSTQTVEINSLTSTTSTHTSELSSMSQSLSEIASIAGSMSTQDSTQNSQISSLSTENSTQASELSSLSTAASELGSEYAVLNSEVADKQDTLTAGAGITITNNVISSTGGISLEVVQTLPTTDISPSIIYLLPKTTAGTDNVYDEYIYVNNAWELIGSTTIDLTNYYNKTEVNSMFTSESSSQSVVDSTQNSLLNSLSTENSTQTSEISSLSVAASELGSELTVLSSEVADTQIDDLTDVDISSPSDNQVLKYNSTSSKWENATAPSGGHTIENSSGTDLTARDTMKFAIPFTATDDSTNQKTDIGLQKLAVDEIQDVIDTYPPRQVVQRDLDDLGDTNITSPANKQVLGYNSTSGKWENVSNIVYNGNPVTLTLSLSGDVLTITTS